MTLFCKQADIRPDTSRIQVCTPALLRNTTIAAAATTTTTTTTTTTINNNNNNGKSIHMYLFICNLDSPEANYKVSKSEEKQRNTYKQNTKASQFI
jgi:hypothetical protein